MHYMNVEYKELQKIMSLSDIEWAASVRIPYNDFSGAWSRLLAIQAKIREAIEAGDVKELEHAPVTVQKAHNVISDKLWDVVNPIDGKPYDSKSAYYKKVKESGCHITDGSTASRAEPDHNVSRELKDALHQHLR